MTFYCEGMEFWFQFQQRTFLSQMVPVFILWNTSVCTLMVFAKNVFVYRNVGVVISTQCW